MNFIFASIESIEYPNTLIILKIDVTFEAARFRLYLNMTLFFRNVYQEEFNRDLLCLFCIFFQF